MRKITELSDRIINDCRIIIYSMLYFEDTNIINISLSVVEENSSTKKGGREENHKADTLLNKRNEWTRETRNVDERVFRVRRWLERRATGV